MRARVNSEQLLLLRPPGDDRQDEQQDPEQDREEDALHAAALVLSRAPVTTEHIFSRSAGTIGLRPSSHVQSLY